MRKVRWTLFALALAVALPVGLLVARALQSLDFERRVRHETVAARVFDEMERELSRLLEREEERPFEEYGFYLTEVPDPVRSPLSRAPTEPFIVGYFQIDPDGSVHTPRRPRDERAATAAGDWPLPGDDLARTEELLRLVRSSWQGRDRERKRRSPGRLSGTEIFSVTGLAKSIEEEPREIAPHPSPTAKKESPDWLRESASTAYDVLQSLNRGADQRLDRRQKVAEAPASRVYARSTPAAEPEDAGFGSASAADADEEALADDLAERDEQSPTRGLSAGVRLPAARAAAPSLQGPATVQLTFDPMVGQALDADASRIVLYRTVVVGARGYRQGLVLDRAALSRHLEAEFLEAGGLAGRASARFAGAGLEAASAPSDGYSFVHRFGEPFDDFGLWLDLAPLDGVTGAGTLYALCILLALAAGAGLLAVDRMVSVTVDFAERRSNFVAAVSHELKTPLTSIRMYAEMLRDGLVPSEAKRDEYARTITDESERLSRLINNVLEFSRLEKGRRDLSLSVGDIGPLVAEAGERLRPHAEREGFELRVEIDDDLTPVLFDRDALLQVLFNLVDNAVKYAAGAETRTIVLRCRSMEGGVELGVRDFGPGVPRAHLSRVFEPFYRAETELTRSARGTGIGLALVRELAEAMGATIAGENADDGGFRVRLGFRPA